MKTERKYPLAVITKKAEASVKNGHPWVYAEEITERKGAFENGCLCDVFSSRGSYLGTGFYSEKSKIAVRILSNNANETFSDAFFARRVSYAVDYRKNVMKEDFSVCRLIFGEADGLPGLTVDKFGDVLVAQVLSFGTDKRKDILFKALVQKLADMGEPVRGLFERNDVAIRELEGLAMYKGWYEGIAHTGSTEQEIVENGVRYLVDIENGQKTGFFLDQKYNRKAVARLAEGHTVLDCFTHTGSFALNAAMGGAAHVTAVDVSSSAIDMAKENARRNGLSDRMDFIVEDVFELLPNLCENKARGYDFVILDPPAFTKSRKTADSAERGYKEINYRAMKLLPRGGYLATCSCSHFMPSVRFEKMLRDAARDAGVQLRQIEMRQQGPDHPVLWNVPETDYLKFYIFQLV